MILFALSAAFLTIFSTFVLLYVSFATGLGPWIGPLLVLLCRLGIWGAAQSQKRTIALLTIIASYGGAIATGIGFSFTTLYFIDRSVWEAWLASPLWFCMFMGLLVLSAGLFGVALARRIMPHLAADESITFPVSTAITTAIEEARGAVPSFFFGGGITLAGLVGVLREQFGSVLSMVPFEFAPTCWAAGFLAGGSIIVPLLVGMAAKYAALEPFWQYTRSISWGGLSLLQMPDVTFAFCSGILLIGLLNPYLFNPWLLVQHVRAVLRSLRRNTTALQQGAGVELCAVIAMGSVCVAFGMPVAALAIFILFLVPLLENLGAFAARTGLATYGRYMTLAMLPLLCFPGVSYVQIVIVCMLIGIAGAAVVDTLFSYKIAEHFHIAETRLRLAQLGGILLTALFIGFLVWILCSSFTLGQAPLIAHRGLSRALLMQSFQFNWWVVGAGMLFGLVLEQLRVNAVMVFGGLIMPNGLIIALTLGALARVATTRVIPWTLFWSGMLVGDVAWMLYLLFTAFLR